MKARTFSGSVTAAMQHRQRTRASSKGAVAVMFAGSLIVIMGMFGLALDLSRLYNRKAELQNVADAAALAAASELNGTAAGLANAAIRAKSSAELLRYQYDNATVVWMDGALRFGDAPGSTNWVGLAEAKLSPALFRYAKVETSELDAQYSAVDMFFIQVVAPALKLMSIHTRAIAGRTTSNVAPLAICAMSAAPGASRTWPGSPAIDELIEYGFRRGVAYDLMQLNPGGVTPENFIVDPFAIPVGENAAGNTSPAIVGPYVCGGTVALAKVLNAKVVVKRDFPIGTYYKQLNSRFDQFEAKSSGAYCSPDVAPPDVNIKEYPFGSISWMSTVPEAQTAKPTDIGGRHATVADLVPPASAGTTAPMYGPLWSFARAVPFSAWQAGQAEPAAGYASFGVDSWATLYNPGQPVAAGYPASGTPYAASGGATFKSPSVSHKGMRNRRVLNIPLLACPVSSTTPAVATVLGIGKFFMTVPATPTQLSAEFGGLVSEQFIGGDVELYP